MSKDTNNQPLHDEDYERRYKEYYDELYDYESQFLDEDAPSEEPYLDPAFSSWEEVNKMFFKI